MEQFLGAVLVCVVMVLVEGVRVYLSKAKR